MRSVAHWHPAPNGGADDRALGAEARPGLGGHRSERVGGPRR